MRQIDELLNDAHEAYEFGRYHESAVCFEQAQRLAQQAGLLELRYQSAIWAAVNWQLATRPLRALSLLMEALAKPAAAANQWHEWAAHIQAFEIIRDYQPYKVEQKLEELKRLVKQHSKGSVSDYLWLKMGVRMEQGQTSIAIERGELAWVRKTPTGFMKYLIAHDLVLCYLKCRDRRGAELWCRQLEETECYFAESRAAWHDARVRLALWDQDQPALVRELADFQDAVESVQRPKWRRRLIELEVRALLLNMDLGDPAQFDHPARRRLHVRVKGPMILSEWYGRRLLLLDYRLAALRYALGLSAVEDLYDARPQMSTAQRADVCSDDAEIQRRIGRVRRAIKKAEVIANRLDQCFRCQWRLAEVQERARRLGELVVEQREASPADLIGGAGNRYANARAGRG